MARLADPEAWSRLAAARSAVLVTIGPDGAPEPIPIVYAPLEGRRLLTAVDQKPKKSRTLSRLVNIAADERVSILADHYVDDAWDELWWVRATGRATVTEERPADAEALEARYPQYVANPPKGPWIEITVDEVIGWAASA